MPIYNLIFKHVDRKRKAIVFPVTYIKVTGNTIFSQLEKSYFRMRRRKSPNLYLS